MSSRIRRFLLLIMLICTLVVITIQGQSAAKASVTVNAPVNPNLILQDEFQGWGTSLAWWADVVGGWSEPERSQLMNYLFTDSFTLNSQTVQGINLNIVRYNLGASEPGVTYQVVDPHLPPRNGAWIDSLIQANGTYDWTVDENQRWVLENSAQLGADTFEIFANSPPWWMTYSGHPAGRYRKTSIEGCSHTNLNPIYHDDFAEYLATVVDRFATVGVNGTGSTKITFKTIEPFNEPSNGWWCWGNNQEGTYMSASDQSSVILEIQSSLDSRNLDTEIAATDSNNYDLVATEYNALSAAARAELDQINAHGYAGSDPEPIQKHVAANDMRFWQSEWGPADWGGYSINSELEAALELATRVNNDLSYVKANGWLYWQAVEDNTRGDGPGFWGLIQAPLDGSAQTYDIQKQFYTLGQYSKFIRPGYLIIDAGNGKTVAAFDPDNDKLVLVTYNDTSESLPMSFDLSRFTTTGASAQVWRTSSTENLAQLSSIAISNGLLNATVPSNSVTTFVVSNVSYNAAGTTAEIINDSDSAFTYSGTWSDTGYSGGGTGAYGLWNQDEHSSQSTNATASYPFYGTNVHLFATIADSSGKIAVSIDGGPETIVNLYNSVRLDGVLVWSSPNLSAGRHTLQLRITGQSGASGGGVWGNVDRLVIENSGWTYCASEGQTCSFTGTAEIRYGTDGIYTRGVHTDGVSCNNATFGDSAPGNFKYCYYRNVSTTSLVPLHSHKCAGVSASSTSDGADILQWACIGVNDQAWVLDEQTNGYHLKPSHATNKCMDVSGASSSDGANVLQWSCGTGSNQEWDFVYVRDGFYQLRPNHTSGMCLAVANESTANGATLEQWTCNEYANQLWELNVP